jgi:hypothetical protein
MTSISPIGSPASSATGCTPAIQAQPPPPAAKPVNQDGFQTSQGPNSGSATTLTQDTTAAQHALYVTA